MKSSDVKWVLTGNYLIIHFKNQKPTILEKGSDCYHNAKAILTKKDFDPDELLGVIEAGIAIEKSSKGLFKVEGDHILIDGKPAHGVIAERILKFFKGGYPYEPLIKFYKNIQENPS